MAIGHHARQLDARERDGRQKLILRISIATTGLRGVQVQVKGKSALALSRDLGLSYKSAFVLLHKLREAMAEERKGRVVGREGKTAEVDGGYFGGYVKPANLKEKRVDRRFAVNQNGSARSL
jgi:hypothetical protein